MPFAFLKHCNYNKRDSLVSKYSLPQFHTSIFTFKETLMSQTSSTPSAILNTKDNSVQNGSHFSGITGSFLKIFAICVMFIDHATAGILEPMLMTDSLPNLSIAGISLSYNQWAMADLILRSIGRSAFPIFCFLLVEGFSYTHSRSRYLLNLSLFALLSETPFDLSVNTSIGFGLLDPIALIKANGALYWNHQNVFFTLALGLAAIWTMDIVIAKFQSPKFLGYLLSLLPLALFCAIAYYANTDYDLYGIILIALLYFFRKKRISAVCAGYFFFAVALFNGLELFSLPGFILILIYNGKRGCIGKKFKYFFYAFYPVHLLLVYLLRAFIV